MKMIVVPDIVDTLSTFPFTHSFNILRHVHGSDMASGVVDRYGTVDFYIKFRLTTTSTR